MKKLKNDDYYTYKILEDFYWHPDKDIYNMPREQYAISTRFEAGGAYETWGWVIIDLRDNRIVAEGKFLDDLYKSFCNYARICKDKLTDITLDDRNNK